MAMVSSGPLNQATRTFELVQLDWIRLQFGLLSCFPFPEMFERAISKWEDSLGMFWNSLTAKREREEGERFSEWRIF